MLVTSLRRSPRRHRRGPASASAYAYAAFLLLLAAPVAASAARPASGGAAPGLAEHLGAEGARLRRAFLPGDPGGAEVDPERLGELHDALFAADSGACGTPQALRLGMEALMHIDDHNLDAVRALLAARRPGPRPTAAVAPAASSTYTYSTPKFAITYQTSGDDALQYGRGNNSFTVKMSDGTSRSVSSANSAPDYVELLGIFLEYAWDKYYRQWAFDKGGDDHEGVPIDTRITVGVMNVSRSFSMPPYIDDAADLIPYFTFGMYDDPVPYNVVIQRDIDVASLSGKIRLAQLAAHELFHQMEYRYVEWLSDLVELRNDGSLDSVALEGTAEAAADAVWDRVPAGQHDYFDLARQASDFLGASNRTLLYDLDSQGYSYDTAIFFRFLMDQLYVHRYPSKEGAIGIGFMRDFWKERYDELDMDYCTFCADQSRYALDTLVTRVTKNMYENWDDYLQNPPSGSYVGDPRFPSPDGIDSKALFIYFTIANYLTGIASNTNYSSPVVHLESRKDNIPYDANAYSDYERGNIFQSWPRPAFNGFDPSCNCYRGGLDWPSGSHTYEYHQKTLDVSKWSARYFRYNVTSGKYATRYKIDLSSYDALSTPYLAEIRRYERCTGWSWYSGDAIPDVISKTVDNGGNCGKFIELGVIVGERDFIEWDCDYWPPECHYQTNGGGSFHIKNEMWFTSTPPQRAAAAVPAGRGVPDLHVMVTGAGETDAEPAAGGGRPRAKAKNLTVIVQNLGSGEMRGDFTVELWRQGRLVRRQAINAAGSASSVAELAGRSRLAGQLPFGAGFEALGSDGLVAARSERQLACAATSLLPGCMLAADLEIGPKDAAGGLELRVYAATRLLARRPL